MKLRILPITITAALSAALLFGGWFAYRHYGVVQPLDRVAASIEGVESAKVETSSGEVKMDVALKPDANIADVYRRVKADGERAIGGKKLELNASAGTSASLDKAWSYALFDVAEAMENRTYTGVRAAMDKISDKFAGITATTEMDDDNVYITLRDGDKAKFVILPREAATMGVWPNA